ncbi:hypothetical protein ACWN8X_08055, partial [Pediococcus argentinicus]
IHMRGNLAVQNELGILLMTMNLTKLAKLLANSFNKSKGFTQKAVKKQKSVLILIDFEKLELIYYFRLVISQPLYFLLFI